MKENITCNKICSFYNGKVQIDELKSFSDSRGFVCELWRADDSNMNSDYIEDNSDNIIENQKVNSNNDNSPQMCYYSHTEPLIMRGPHQHTDQTDWFITIKSRMMYQFYDDNSKNCEYFITDPQKMYRVKVEPGIIHAYRNLSYNNVAMTANFPSSLFKGINKKEDIDEIRHEPYVEENKNIYILGSDGRLGKALVEELIRGSSIDSGYNVIPINSKFSISELDLFLDNITDDEIRTENDIVINCIAKTNVQDDTNEEDFNFSNFEIPKHLTEFCIRHKFYLVNFSTDYIYQTGKESIYTRTKKKYENWLEQIFDSDDFLIHNITKYLNIVRLANLFSLEDNDTHNAITKIYNAIINNKVNTSRNLKLMLTDVKDISKFLNKKYLHHLEEFTPFINLSGKAYELEYIIREFYESDVDINYIDNPSTINNPDVFLNRDCYFELDCDNSIKEKIRKLKNG